MEANNAYAYYNFAGWYARGLRGVPQDIEKSNELLLKAGEFGCAEGYCNLGFSYRNGNGVNKHPKKGLHFYELAAMNGNVQARHNLGCVELEAGNYDRAFKHFILAARAGEKLSLVKVKNGFLAGLVTEDEYSSTLRAHQKIQDEMKSDSGFNMNDD